MNEAFQGSDILGNGSHPSADLQKVRAHGTCKLSELISSASLHHCITCVSSPATQE